MKRWITMAGVVSGALVLGGATVLVASGFAWRRDTARSVTRVLVFAGGGTDRMTRRARDDVPPPVARYLDFALSDDAPAGHTARVTWRGEFRMRPDADWVPFTASQVFTVNPPGFVWDARMRALPLVPVRVRDAYVAGEASMLGRIGGLVTVVDQSGSAELAQSALARWIGEAVWFPMALLPRDGLRWEALDDSTARVVVQDGSTTASAEFHFAPTGEVLRMSAMRYRDVEGKPVLTLFEGIYRDYTDVGGVMVPGSAEVAWLLPEGRFAYWRGRPVDIRYEVDHDERDRS